MCVCACLCVCAVGRAYVRPWCVCVSCVYVCVCARVCAYVRLCCVCVCVCVCACVCASVFCVCVCVNTLGIGDRVPWENREGTDYLKSKRNGRGDFSARKAHRHLNKPALIRK